MSNLNKLAEELEWLKKNPAFIERPATLIEFLGPEYLNIEKGVRKRIKEELSEILGKEVSGTHPTKYPLAIVTGGIGIGKTTIASVVLPYLAHWLLCLRDPQDFFDLLPGSRIALMEMSTSEAQAREVVFGDIKARIQHSPWFKKHPMDPAFKNQIRFDKDIWILPGDSKDTTFEGYNIFGGIIDEADSHQVTVNKDYAQDGYDAIENRITSRFQDRGFLLVIGQMKQSAGFAARKYDEFKNRPDAYAVRLAIWESLGDEFFEKDENGVVKTFAYDVARKQIMPDGVVGLLNMSEQVMIIPEVYRRAFKNNPEKALKDLAGIPPAVNDPFISLVNKIDAARDRWIIRYPGLKSPVRVDGRLEPWFKAHNTLQRAVHIDLAYSGEGDALGFAMGHVPEMVVREGERKPYIVIDMLLRIKARPGGEIFLADIRKWVYMLIDDLKFKINRVTMDGFESTETMQQLQRRRINAEYLSIDRDVLPYHDLREAIYEDRIDYPPYVVEIQMDSGSIQQEILIHELTHLMDTGKKIDHPLNGSKDVADSVAGVTFSLMGDRRYHRNGVNLDTSQHHENSFPSLAGLQHPAYRGDSGLSAPLPPTWR